MQVLRTAVVAVAILIASESRSYAQLVVSDPTNLAQGIINASKNIVYTAQTASSVLDNFEETKKIYEQGKKYYDALQQVNNLVRDAQKVKLTIEMVAEISEIYVTNFNLMRSDSNFTAEELTAIAYGYTRLLAESVIVLDQLQEVVNISTLSLTDKDRIDVVDKCYKSACEYRNLVTYFTNKNISVSYLRSKRYGDTSRITSLYGGAADRYW
ncbi:MAG: DUF4141 domain-containing protein [Rikenellaceae bacterium]